MFCTFVLLASAIGFPQQPASPPGAGEGAGPDAPALPEGADVGLGGASGLPELRGYTELKYIGRWTDGAADHDLRAYASLDLGDRRKHLVTAHASGRLALDLDRSRSPTHPFRSVDDTYDSSLTARLYDAYADLNGVEGNPIGGLFERVRLGRQIFYDTPETLFVDGLSFRTQPATGFADLRLSGFVGVPSHLFESSPRGDFTVGGAATVSPLPSGQLRFDYVHLTDEYQATTRDDDLYGLSGYQRVGDSLFFTGRVNFLRSDARDTEVHITWTPPRHDFSLTARYTGLLSDQKRSSIDLDYFTTFQATYYAYDQFELFAYKGLGDHISLDGGIQVRELRENSNEGVFNHGFRRYFVSPSVAGWPWAGTTLSLTGEHWDSEGDDFTAFGSTLAHEFSERWRGSVGTYFQLYRYDVLLDQEREDVQVSYARLDHRAVEGLRLRVAFEFEDGDAEDFATLTFSARIRL